MFIAREVHRPGASNMTDDGLVGSLCEFIRAQFRFPLALVLRHVGESDHGGSCLGRRHSTRRQP
jgi:hypothetical protein